jgi:hypothetical protein
MQDNISFLRRRHASLSWAVENLEHNFNMLHDFQEFPVVEFKEIQDRIKESLSEVKAIRVSISDKIAELENESE